MATKTIKRITKTREEVTESEEIYPFCADSALYYVPVQYFRIRGL